MCVVDKKRHERERAPWERDPTNDDAGRDFDENAFLGRSISETDNDQSGGVYYMIISVDNRDSVK